MSDETKSISTFNKNFTKEISDITLYDIETGKEFLNINYHSKCPINYDYDNCSSKEYGYTCDTCCHYDKKSLNWSFSREVKFEMKESFFDIKGLYKAMYSLDIMEDKNLVVSDAIRVKTHKRKRIDKKWKKKYGWRTIWVPDKNIYVLPNKKIIAHPSVVHTIIDAIKNNENVRYL